MTDDEFYAWANRKRRELAILSAINDLLLGFWIALMVLLIIGVWS